jgi:hypothetical protein
VDSTPLPWPDDGTFYTKERVNEPLVGPFPTAEQMKAETKLLAQL